MSTKVIQLDYGEYTKEVQNKIRELIHIARNKKLSEKNIEIIKLALSVASSAHFGQMRKTGAPYIIHPIEVAIFIAKWGLDEQIIAGALMHDVVEDTDLTIEDIEGIFGFNIANLVHGVTKLDKLHFVSEEVANAEYFRKIVLAMAQDIRVIIIKLADRLHNMMTLDAMKKNKQIKISLETMEIYVPIADRIGLHIVRDLLADNSFKYLFPIRYKVLYNANIAREANFAAQIQSIQSVVKNAARSHGIEIRMQYEPNNIFGLYQRMKKSKNISLKTVFDSIDLKVFTNNVANCYLLLGIIHSLYRPIPNKFKDYIASPKQNGYQALHITVINVNSMLINFHINTEEMAQIASFGIINYLMKSNQQEEYHQPENNVITNILNNILETKTSSLSTTDFINNIKKDLSYENIHVFTPKGKIIILPKNATPIDFAYAIHTDIGNSCVSAKVNHRTMNIYSKLHSGDIVEIITGNVANPQLDWINHVASNKTVNKIKYFLRMMQYDEHVEKGKKIILSAISLLVDKNQQNFNQQDLLQNSDLMYQISTGESQSLSILSKLIQNLHDNNQLLVIDIGGCKLISTHIEKDLSKKITLIQHDCCFAVSGISCLAKFNYKFELHIHRLECNIIRMQQQSLFTKINLVNSNTHLLLSAKINVYIKHDPGVGVLNTLTNLFVNQGINLIGIDQKYDNHTLMLSFIVQINNQHVLDLLKEDIACLDFVSKIE